jgi:hypothetical protein
MLNRDDIAQLHRELQDQQVLSVYLKGGAKDFAERKAWRIRLEHAVSEIRRGLTDAPSDFRDSFDGAFQQIQNAVASFDFLPDRGWVGFAVSDRLIFGNATRVPMPDVVRWEVGARIAPYVRALKQDRLVVGLLVDSRKGRVFEYRDGHMQESDDLLGDIFAGDLTDVNVSRRATSYSGVRGETGVDAGQRVLAVEAERLLKRLVEVVVPRVGTKGVLVVGGVPESVRDFVAHLPPAVRERTIERTAATLDMSAPEAVEMIEGAASELSRRIQDGLLQEVVDQARSGGKGALGGEAVELALQQGRVDTLLLSRTFIQREPDLADRLVNAAFDFHGEIEELSAEGADRLDAEGGGVAARLRYSA